MNVESAYSSHQGGRDEQQDHVVVLTGAHDRLLVVADGMGGHVGGQIASRAVVETAHDLWEAWDRRSTEPKDFIVQLIATAHAAINQLGEEQGIQPRSTCVILYLDQDRAVWGHVGDSRLYRFANGQVVERTRDHSVPQMLLDMGKITEDEVATHPDQNRLTQSLGGDNEPEPDLGEAPLRSGDAFLLCSDGLWERVTPDRMAEALYGDALDDIVGRLPVEAYEVEKHSSDNISIAVATVDVTPGAIAAVPSPGPTAVAAPVAEVAAAGAGQAAPRAPGRRGASAKIVGGLVAVLVVGGAGVYAAVKLTDTAQPPAAGSSGGDLDGGGTAPSGAAPKAPDLKDPKTDPQRKLDPKKLKPALPPDRKPGNNVPQQDRVQPPQQRRGDLTPATPPAKRVSPKTPGKTPGKTPDKPRKVVAPGSPGQRLPRFGWLPGLDAPGDPKSRDLGGSGRKPADGAKPGVPTRAKPATTDVDKDNDRKAPPDGKKKTAPPDKKDKKDEEDTERRSQDKLDATGWTGDGDDPGR